MIDLTLYEVARRNMVKFAKHYINNELMTKEQWFLLQEEVLKEIEENSKQ